MIHEECIRWFWSLEDLQKSGVSSALEERNASCYYSSYIHSVTDIPHSAPGSDPPIVPLHHTD